MRRSGPADHRLGTGLFFRVRRTDFFRFSGKKHPLPFSSIRSCRRIPDDGTLPFVPGKLASQITLTGWGFRFLYSKDSYFSSCVMAETFSMFHVEHSQGTSPANALPHPMTAAEIRRGFCTGAPKQSNLSQTGKSSLPLPWLTVWSGQKLSSLPVRSGFLCRFFRRHLDSVPFPASGPLPVCSTWNIYKARQNTIQSQARRKDSSRYFWGCSARL